MPQKFFWSLDSYVKMLNEVLVVMNAVIWMQDVVYSFDELCSAAHYWRSFDFLGQ